VIDKKTNHASVINQKQNESLTGSSYIDNRASYSLFSILVFFVNRQRHSNEKKMNPRSMEMEK